MGKKIGGPQCLDQKTNFIRDTFQPGILDPDRGRRRSGGERQRDGAEPTTESGGPLEGRQVRGDGPGEVATPRYTSHGVA